MLCEKAGILYNLLECDPSLAKMAKATSFGQTLPAEGVVLQEEDL